MTVNKPEHTVHDYDACTYKAVTPQNHPSETPGARINKGRGNGGSSLGDKTNYITPPGSNDRKNPALTHLQPGGF